MKPAAPSPISVLLIEDDPATQDRLIQALEQSDRIVLLGTATTAKEAYAQLFMTEPRVVLVDLGLPDGSGIEIIRWVSKNKPNADSMVITAFGDEYHVLNSLEAGASGYLLKDCTAGEIADHIVELTEGGSPISPMVARQLLTRIQEDNPQPNPPSELVNSVDAVHQAKPKREIKLTERELAVIKQVAKGFNTVEIAAQLGISAHTVSTHVKRIYRKLHVSNRAEAVFEAGASGLLNED